MKKKMIGRVSAMTMAGAMMFGGMQIPALAATGDNDGVVQFQKVLEMQNAQGASVPNVTYTYSISAGSAIGATATSPEIKAGVGKPTATCTSMPLSLVSKVTFRSTPFRSSFRPVEASTKSGADTR